MTCDVVLVAVLFFVLFSFYWRYGDAAIFRIRVLYSVLLMLLLLLLHFL